MEGRLSVNQLVRTVARRSAAADALRKIQSQLEEQGGVWTDPNDADEDADESRAPLPTALGHVGKRRRTAAAPTAHGSPPNAFEDGVDALDVKVESLAHADADIATLDGDGFQIFRAAYKASRTQLKEWRHLVNRQSHSIFNAGDTRRRQVHLEPPRDLQAVAARAAPHLKADEWVVLQSTPGCAPQPPHCDWNPHTVSCDAATVPCGLLIATMPDTPLDVWPGSWRHVRESRDVRTDACRQVTLGAGDAILFRADLVHAGAEWPTTRRRSNLRIHAYLDAPGVVRQDDYSFRVHST